MAESSGLDKFLKAQLKQGFELARELETQLNFAEGPDCTNFICNYLDKIVIAFSSARGLISLNSSASNFEGTENPIENHFGGIEARHSQKYVRDNRSSCARSPSRSPCPQSRSPSPTGYNSPSNLSELSVSINRFGTGKQKCNEFAESWENEGFSKDREPVISRKRRYTPTSTTIVPANSSEPGNDIPQEDGYTWRKYGQKEILGDKHPRMYYKCTYWDDRGCKAKKIVQRTNDNPSVFHVNYSELHSCQRDAQFFKNPFPGSAIKTPFPGSAFQAYDGGVTLDSFVRSPSNLPNVDSSAKREIPFTSHSAAYQMPILQSSEKEASTDLMLHYDSEWLWTLPGESKHGNSSSSPGNPPMQTWDTWDLWTLPGESKHGNSSSSPGNPPMQTRDTWELRSPASESDIAKVVSTTNSEVSSPMLDLHDVRLQSNSDLELVDRYLASG